MPESIQHELDRKRPPRVQITYDVEIGGAIQKKELPLVVGVLADLSGKPDKEPPKLRDRKFVEIDRDNFNGVLKAAAPRLVLDVDDKLSKDKQQRLKAELVFEHMDDFTPMNLVKKIEPLRKLLEAREKLNDLLAKLDGNDELEAKLQEIVAKTEQLNELKAIPRERKQSEGEKK